MAVKERHSLCPDPEMHCQHTCLIGRDHVVIASVRINAFCRLLLQGCRGTYLLCHYSIGKLCARLPDRRGSVPSNPQSARCDRHLHSCLLTEAGFSGAAEAPVCWYPSSVEALCACLPAWHDSEPTTLESSWHN